MRCMACNQPITTGAWLPNRMGSPCHPECHTVDALFQSAVDLWYTMATEAFAGEPYETLSAVAEMASWLDVPEDMREAAQVGIIRWYNDVRLL